MSKYCHQQKFVPYLSGIIRIDLLMPGWVKASYAKVILL